MFKVKSQHNLRRWCRRGRVNGAPHVAEPDVAVKSVDVAHTPEALHVVNAEMDMMAMAARWGRHCLGATAAFWSPLFHDDGATRRGTTFHIVMP